MSPKVTLQATWQQWWTKQSMWSTCGLLYWSVSHLRAVVHLNNAREMIPATPAAPLCQRKMKIDYWSKWIWQLHGESGPWEPYKLTIHSFMTNTIVDTRTSWARLVSSARSCNELLPTEILNSLQNSVHFTLILFGLNPILVRSRRAAVIFSLLNPEDTPRGPPVIANWTKYYQCFCYGMRIAVPHTCIAATRRQ